MLYLDLTPEEIHFGFTSESCTPQLKLYPSIKEFQGYFEHDPLRIPRSSIGGVGGYGY